MDKQLSLIFFTIGVLFLNQLATADTRMIFEVPDGEFTTWSNDKYFRAIQSKVTNQENRVPGDMLGDLRNKKSYLIIDKDKVLVEMTNPKIFLGLDKIEKAPKVNLVYKSLGKGPNTAGFSTIKYDIIAEGKKCFTVLLTKDNSYKTVMERYNSLNTGEENETHDLCDAAEKQIEEDMDSKYGYPVKVIDANGQTQLRLKEFKTNLTAPKNYLTFPKNYKVLTMQDLMKKAMEDAMKNGGMGQ